MKNKCNSTDWLIIYNNFVSTVWRNNNQSDDEQVDLINDLLGIVTDNENSVEIIGAKNNLRTCLFLLNLNYNQEVAIAKNR